jgi:Tol biopolymer transport system component
MNLSPHLDGRRAGAAVAALAAAGASPAGTTARTDGGIVFGRGGELHAGGPGTAALRLTTNRAHEGLPAWSPDRRQVVFVRDSGRDSDIDVMRADGAGVRRLTSGPGPARGAQDSSPAWSPDGKLIAFSSTRGDREPGLDVMRPAGMGVRRLTRTPRHLQNVRPRFSPDGRLVVVASHPHRVLEPRALPHPRRRRGHAGAADVLGLGRGRRDDLTPTYSPDGKWIAFVSDRQRGYGVWTMRAEGTGLRRVVPHRAGRAVAFPRSSPDGGPLVFTTFSQDSAPDRPPRLDGRRGRGDADAAGSRHRARLAGRG